MTHPGDARGAVTWLRVMALALVASAAMLTTGGCATAPLQAAPPVLSNGGWGWPASPLLAPGWAVGHPRPAVGSTDGAVSWYSPALPAMLAAAGVDVRGICPSGVLTVQDGETFISRMQDAYEGRVWYDSTVEVSCAGRADAGSETLRLSPAQMRQIAAHPATLAEVSRFAPRCAGRLAEALATQASPHPLNLARSPLGTPWL